MSDLQLRQLDLNLLRIFDVLWSTRSVTLSAERLCLTPSAVSHALNKLRIGLDDELFRRGSGGMQPTALARDIGPRVHAALSQIHLALAPSSFAPLETRRAFQIGATPYASWMLLPKLLQTFGDAAPNASLHFIRYEVRTLEAVDSGFADLAIGPFEDVPDRFEHFELFSDELVWVTGCQTDAPEDIGLDTIAGMQHIQVATASTGMDQLQAAVQPGMYRYASLMNQGNLDAALAEFGFKARKEITVPNMLTAFAAVSSSGCGMLSPRHLATAMARLYPLRLSRLRCALDRLHFKAVWKSDADPAVTWLIGLIREAAARLDPTID